MIGKIGGITYFFEPDERHKKRFWKAAIKNLIKQGYIKSELYNFNHLWSILQLN